MSHANLSRVASPGLWALLSVSVNLSNDKLSQRDRATLRVGLKSCQLLHNCTIYRILKRLQWMTLKVTLGHWRRRYSIGYRSSLYSKNVSIFHSVRDITTFTVNVTAYDFKKSFSFVTTVKSTGHIHVRFPIHMQTYPS